MKWMIKICFLGIVAINTLALAEEPRIVNWWASGTKDCNKKVIQLIQNGNAYSFLFNQFGPQLEENGNRAADVRTCHLTVLFEVPKNMCIYQIDHLISGGLIKTYNSRGKFKFVARLNGANKIKQKTVWDYGSEITPEDPESVITYSIAQPTKCVGFRYQTFSADFLFTASKRTRRDFFLGAIDSLDNGVSIQLRTR